MESYLGRHSGSWEGEQSSAVTVKAWNGFGWIFREVKGLYLGIEVAEPAGFFIAGC
jgi:hypothetical protein